jgi:hypothetical protein
VTSIDAWLFSDCAGLTSVTIPDTVTRIADGAFFGCTDLTRITLPPKVTSIGEHAFAGCTGLASVCFLGNAPATSTAFDDCPATVYYLPETTGWEPTFSGRPTAVWVPRIEAADADFGVHANRFGFDITWTPKSIVVVEACSDPANPIWVPVSTNTLATGLSSFNDPKWTDFPARFYRLRSK